MTAIQKMVRWLEQEISIKVEDPEDDGYLIATTSALRYANRLADEEAEEQAQKPTAPAGLVEKLMIWEKKWPRASIQGAKEFSEILSRYRPAPSIDEGLREELIKIQNFAASCMECRDEPEFTMFCEIAGELSAILNKMDSHPSTKSDRCAETVQEIRQRVTDYFNHSAWPTEFMKYAHMISDKMHDILDEFEKDTDGKEEM